MIVVDTSVWIAFFRGRPTSVADRLDLLLEANEVALAVPVRLEILSGLRATEVEATSRLLDALPLWVPDASTWARMEAWIRVAGRKGHRFGFGDLLIAAIAADHGATVWSLDGDFERLEALGFIQRA